MFFCKRRNNGLTEFVVNRMMCGTLKKLLSATMLMFIIGEAHAQDTGYGPGYQTMLMNNPGYAGAAGDGTLRLSYLNFYPGNSYNFHTFYASYDSWFSGLHGGAGAWVADDYLGGIINDLRGGVSYAYFLRAGKEVFIHAGLGAAFFQRGFSFSDAVLPDMIDRLGGISLTSAESLFDQSRTVFDINAGFLVIYRNLFAGLSVAHLSQPDMSASEVSERLKRKITLNVSILTGDDNFSLRPDGFIELQGDYLSASAGVTGVTRHIALGVLFTGDSSHRINLQSGFALNLGKLGVFYSYRFNLKSPGFMPFSLLHQTGISFGLNPVDKRNIQGTINMPWL